MTITDPAAHGIVARAKRGQDDALGSYVPTRAERDAVEAFLIRATSDMLRRMRDGLRRGWGAGWTAPGYSDDECGDRLDTAHSHLLSALTNYRAGSVGIDELRKRAADVANQAFMLTDPERLRKNEP